MTDYKDLVALKYRGKDPKQKYAGDATKYESMLTGKSISNNTFADALKAIP